MLAAAVNAPIAAIALVMELFGSSLGPCSTACIVTFFPVKYQSVYPSQLVTLTEAGQEGTRQEEGRGLSARG